MARYGTKPIPAIEIVNCSGSTVRRKMLKHLYGKVFHVTNENGFNGILYKGAIIPTLNEPAFRNWRMESFFRNRGCVSVCDLVNNTSKKHISSAISKYNFFDLRCNNGRTYLFLLNKSVHFNLITWNQWIIEKAYKENIVPHLESGFPGEISIVDIEKIIMINIVNYFNLDAFEKMLEARLKE